MKKQTKNENEKDVYNWIVIGIPSFLYCMPALILFIDLHRIYTYIFIIYLLLVFLRLNYLIAGYNDII